MGTTCIFLIFFQWLLQYQVRGHSGVNNDEGLLATAKTQQQEKQQYKVIWRLISGHDKNCVTDHIPGNAQQRKSVSWWSQGMQETPTFSTSLSCISSAFLQLDMEKPVLLRSAARSDLLTAQRGGPKCSQQLGLICGGGTSKCPYDFIHSLFDAIFFIPKIH